MFSCCLPLSRGRDLQNSSEESRFRRRGRRWVQAQPRRRLWPFSRRDSESSTRVREEQSVEEDMCPISTREGAESHTTEGQSGPAASVATPGSAGPEPWDVRWRNPLPKPTRLHRELMISEHRSPVTRTRSNNLEPQEAAPKAPAPEAVLASASAPVIHTEESNAGAAVEGCPPPGVLPPPAAPPAAAVKPGPPWEAPPDRAEAPPSRPEEPSLRPVLVPAAEEELPPENIAGPALEPLVELALALPLEFILPPLFDYVL